jgi:UPF0042 nucleotide-binding protein
MKLFIVTGCSGAGKSVALKVFEDYGMTCVDNLPLSVLESVTETVSAQVEQLAVCSDVRSPDFDPQRFLETITRLRQSYEVHLLFFTARREVLLSRFNATKHRHPLSDGDGVVDGLERESSLLEPLRLASDVVIDTSDYTPHSLRQHLLAVMGLEARQMLVVLQSFSYKSGIPQHADMVFDVRFLRNPHYDPALRDLTGKDDAVGAYIKADRHYAPYMEHLSTLLHFLVPLYIQEGKHYLAIAIGCTGGQHRSVHVAETLACCLPNTGIRTAVVHHALPS